MVVPEVRRDIYEGEMYPRGLVRFGRIVNNNRDCVERYLLVRFWPGRAFFAALSTSGLYSRMGNAFSFSRDFYQNVIGVNLQFHLRWYVARNQQ